MRALRGRGGAAIGALVVCALVLTGCAAGKKAQTAEEIPAIDGTNASIGKLLLREVSIASPTGAPSYAQGATANLQLVIINTGGTPDTLTGVSTSAASSVGQTAVATTGAAASGSESSSSTPSTSSSSSASGSSSSAPAASFAPVAVEPGSRVSFGIGDAKSVLTLTGLSAQLFPAAVVAITFTFQNAGSVTVQVPVQLTHDANPTGQVVTAGMTSESSAAG